MVDGLVVINASVGGVCHNISAVGIAKFVFVGDICSTVVSSLCCKIPDCVVSL